LAIFNGNIREILWSKIKCSGFILGVAGEVTPLYENVNEQIPSQSNLIGTITELPDLWRFHIEIYPNSPNSGSETANIIHVMGNGDTADDPHKYGNRVPAIFLMKNYNSGQSLKNI